MVCANDNIGRSARNFTYQYFLRQEKYSSIKIPNGGNVAIVILLAKIFHSHTDRCDSILKQR